MDDIIPILPTTQEEEAPIEVVFTKEEVNYFVQAIDFFQPLIKSLFDNVTPTDLPIILAFIQSVLETQIPDLGGAFDEVRALFNQLYPMVLEDFKAKNPEEAEASKTNVIVLYSKPTQEVPAVSLSDEPRIIIPGNGSIN